MAMAGSSEEEDATLHKTTFLQEGALSPECRSLLSRLPSEKLWTHSDHSLYLYKGFRYFPRVLNSLLSMQHNFEADADSDILLATFPKSGATWLKALMFSLLNRSQYSPNSKDHPLFQKNPHELVPFLEMEVYVEDRLPDLSGLAAPRLFATHLPFSALPSTVQSSTNKCKIVYLCRDPKDVAISFWHFTKRWSPTSLEVTVDKFCRGVCPFGPFWDHALEYWNASKEMPNKVLFLKYEDIKEQPATVLRRLAYFLNSSFSEEEEGDRQVEKILSMCSFKNLSELEVNRTGRVPAGVEKKAFFRRGEVGDWRNHLTEEMIHRFDEIQREKLHHSNLSL